MLNNRAEQIREWHEQAVYCAQQADARTDPKVKQQFLELKRLWLLLARCCGFTESPTDFSDEAMRGFLKRPKITQPLAAASSPSISSRWPRAANATPDGWPTVRFFTFRNKN